MKNLPYTVNIITNDSTVIHKLPINEIAHSPILLKNPVFCIAVIISCGKTVCPGLINPADDIILDDIPCIILNIASIKSIP